MKAIKQVVPGVDLPIRYRSNGRGVDVEGGGAPGKYYPPVPFYRAIGGPAVIRWRSEFKERYRLGWYMVRGRGGCNWTPPVILTMADMFQASAVDAGFAWAWRQLSWTARMRFLISGNLWQVFHAAIPLEMDRFIHDRVTASCPVSIKGHEESMRRFPEFSLGVIMSGKNQCDDTGVAEVAIVSHNQGRWSLAGAGDFATDNEAIEVFAATLAAKNRGKWSSAKDALSLGGGQHKILSCSYCGGRVGKWGSPVTSRAIKCGVCGKQYILRYSGFDDMDGELVPVTREEGFRLRATAAGFPEAQITLMEEYVRQDARGNASCT